MTSLNVGKNDYWEILWKVNQILIPIGLAWGIWVTTNLFELKAQVGKPEERFTKSDAQVLRLEVKDWVRANFPTPEEKLQLEDIQSSVKEVATSVNTLKLDVAKIQILQSITDIKGKK